MDNNLDQIAKQIRFMLACTYRDTARHNLLTLAAMLRRRLNGTGDFNEFLRKCGFEVKQ